MDFLSTLYLSLWRPITDEVFPINHVSYHAYIAIIIFNNSHYLAYYQQTTVHKTLCKLIGGDIIFILLNFLLTMKAYVSNYIASSMVHNCMLAINDLIELNVTDCILYEAQGRYSYVRGVNVKDVSSKDIKLFYFISNPLLSKNLTHAYYKKTSY